MTDDRRGPPWTAVPTSALDDLVAWLVNPVRPVPDGVAIVLLRRAQEATLREGRPWPGRRALMDLFGWPERRVRGLLADEARWSDPARSDAWGAYRADRLAAPALPQERPTTAPAVPQPCPSNAPPLPHHATVEPSHLSEFAPPLPQPCPSNAPPLPHDCPDPAPVVSIARGIQHRSPITDTDHRSPGESSAPPVEPMLIEPPPVSRPPLAHPEPSSEAPGWARKAASSLRVPVELILERTGAVVQQLTGRLPPAGKMSGHGATLAALARHLGDQYHGGKPDSEAAWLAVTDDVLLVIEAVRDAPHEAFLRGEVAGRDGQRVDRSRDLDTLCRRERFTSRAEAARRWRDEGRPTTTAPAMSPETAAGFELVRRQLEAERAVREMQARARPALPPPVTPALEDDGVMF